MEDFEDRKSHPLDGGCPIQKREIGEKKFLLGLRHSIRGLKQA
ncbi:MAG: hypothetical protein ACE5PM_08785 [Candidatus Hydrothermarchaeales archaeon]